MAKFVYLANTDAEFEYADAAHGSFSHSWSKYPLCLQLQYLPLLYADPDDLVAVTSIPDESYLVRLMQKDWWAKGLPKMILIDQAQNLNGVECLSWGPSRRVKAWAELSGASYTMPSDWAVVCTVNSKAFSFRYCSLPNAARLENEEELLRWLKANAGPKVLKTCYGLSGRGNFRMEGNQASPELLSFCRKEWGQRRPVIGEPWLNRLLDFSTQWKIFPDKKFELIGATRFATDPFGNYQGTVAGPENRLFSEMLIFCISISNMFKNLCRRWLQWDFLGALVLMHCFIDIRKILQSAYTRLWKSMGGKQCLWQPCGCKDGFVPINC